MDWSAAIAPSEFQCLTYMIADYVALITLNRPERRNALNRRAYDEIEAVFRAAARDRDVRLRGCARR
jgi:enoyl-CoA hydratase/carnithine racemase